jgi:hypothetical protein
MVYYGKGFNVGDIWLFLDTIFVFKFGGSRGGRCSWLFPPSAKNLNLFHEPSSAKNLAKPTELRKNGKATPLTFHGSSSAIQSAFVVRHYAGYAQFIRSREFAFIVT